MESFTNDKNSLIGKAGQHLVCCDLLLRGYNAFIADEGLSYDLLLDLNSAIKKIQVKTTQSVISTKKQKNIYRFFVRMGKKTKQKYKKEDFDILALVFLDINKIAYINVNNITSTDKKHVKTTIEFRDKEKYPSKTQKTKYVQDFTFDKAIGL